MGPKRAENISKSSKLSMGGASVLGMTGAGAIVEQENQQFLGKFAADLELCCRETYSANPITIPVYIRGHPTQSIQIQYATSQNQQQQQPTLANSGLSVTPSVAAGGNAEEQSSSMGKKISRARVPSVSQSGIFIGASGIDNDNRSFSAAGQEQSKTPSPSYRTFHLIPDSEFYRPKLLADSVGSEAEAIEQITALYMRSWELDQRFIDVLKKILPFQEQLHTIDFCFVGLNEQTIVGFVDLCQVIKNLRTVSLDGNPLAAEYFHSLIEKDESKILQLSLRFCNITDVGAERIAHCLGNMSRQNWKLLTLNLSGNRIGDNGAKYFATALRYNRTLISLNLSSNFITDQGAFPLALVLRRIILTPEEIIRRRHLILKRYAEAHPDEFRVNTNSPTPSTVSAKSKSGRSSRGDGKRTADPNKRKTNTGRSSQNVEKRNRNDSDETRPPSENKGDLKKGRNEGNSGRSSALNMSSTTGSQSRRTTTSTSNASSKDSDQSKTPAPSRIRKIATTVNVTTKKNISIVKEEDEDAIQQSLSLPIQSSERDNPLFETNEFESRDGEMCLRGNFVLLSLNLSRNYLTIDSVRQFLLSIQQQSAFTNINDALNLSSTTTSSPMNLFGLCRLELKGMNDISMKSSEYQSMDVLMAQKNPLFRFQQMRDREAKELLDSQSIQASQQTQQSVSEKIANTSEKPRAGSSSKTSNQRPTSRLKD